MASSDSSVNNIKKHQRKFTRPKITSIAHCFNHSMLVFASHHKVHRIPFFEPPSHSHAKVLKLLSVHSPHPQNSFAQMKNFTHDIGSWKPEILIISMDWEFFKDFYWRTCSKRHYDWKLLHVNEWTTKERGNNRGDKKRLLWHRTAHVAQTKHIENVDNVDNENFLYIRYVCGCLCVCKWRMWGKIT